MAGTVPNSFYTTFDQHTFPPHRDPLKKEDFRTVFGQDRDRIIHSSAFRRLQAKTQVFQPGEYDFYRTRLTHSLEVAQIGRNICRFLRHRGEPLSDTSYIDEDLVEACCLAHDIGNPPFGHAGETVLNRLMQPYGGFEGNAQTLRLVTDMLFSDGKQRRGMAPSRAFVDGILKYKTLWTPENGPTGKFLYNDQSAVLDFVANEESDSPARTNPSIECSIMEWADDTAYSLGDLTDGVRARFVTPSSMAQWAERNAELLSIQGNQAAFNALAEAIDKRELTRHIAKKIGTFIMASSLSEKAEYSSPDYTNRYRYALDVKPDIKEECKLYKRISIDLVFATAEVHQLEHKTDHLLSRMFKSFENEYLQAPLPERPRHLLPKDTLARVLAVPQSEPQKRARHICDHLAGVSDDFAVRTYRRMFEPTFGSLVDLV
ncbi:MAG: dGTP triphosphohydrolase [Bryobacteraceae bacterium]